MRTTDFHGLCPFAELNESKARHVPGNYGISKLHFGIVN